MGMPNVPVIVPSASVAATTFTPPARATHTVPAMRPSWVGTDAYSRRSCNGWRFSGAPSSGPSARSSSGPTPKMAKGTSSGARPPTSKHPTYSPANE